MSLWTLNFISSLFTTVLFSNFHIFILNDALDPFTKFLPFFFFLVQLAVAYGEALLNSRLAMSNDCIIQSTFLGSLRKRVEDIFNLSSDLKTYLQEYLRSGTWPQKDLLGWKCATILSWYLQWYHVPTPYALRQARQKLRLMSMSSSSVPLLHLLFPATHAAAIDEISNCMLFESKGWELMQQQRGCWCWNKRPSIMLCYCFFSNLEATEGTGLQ